MDDPLSGANRKRAAAPGECGERPSKRRRLGQASILCMRELFRTVVNDGDISEDKRILLQNAGVLLSQVDGKTWVSFPDNQGELRELTPQQLRHLRPFFDQVAEELKMREVQLLSDSAAGSSDQLDCLELSHVPWADGITARELLACCSPDETLHFTTRWNWLEVLIRILPSKYMLKSRVKELVNYYYIQGLTPEAVTPKQNTSTEVGEKPAPSVPRRVLTEGAQRMKLCLQISRSAARFFSGLVAQLVLLVTQAFTVFVGRLMWYLPYGDDPAWPLARLFFAVLLQGQIKKFLELIVLIARLRVILCLARSSEVFGVLFFPFVIVARKILGWNEGSWLLGCSCDASGRPSLLSYGSPAEGPVRAAEGLMACLKAVQHLQTLPGLSMLGIIVDPFVDAMTWIEPAVVFLGDLIFSVGFAEGLAMIVRSVDKSAHHKLVWMSMNVGRMLREGPPAEVNRLEVSTDEKSSEQLIQPTQVADSQQPLPEWREDGTWNLFDGGD